MNYKALLDVAMPGTPAQAAEKGIWWIVVFIILAFVIAIVSVIVVRKGVKKAGKDAKLMAAEEQLPADEAEAQQNLKY